MNKKLIIFIFASIIIISNVATSLITYYCTEKTEEFDKLKYGVYKLRQNAFEDVLYSWFIPTDSILRNNSQTVLLSKHPVVMKWEKQQPVFIDISYDSIINKKHYYCRQRNYLPDIRDGDTLWIDGETIRKKDSTGKYPINLSRIYVRTNYTALVKSSFRKMK